MEIPSVGPFILGKGPGAGVVAEGDAPAKPKPDSGNTPPKTEYPVFVVKAQIKPLNIGFVVMDKETGNMTYFPGSEGQSRYETGRAFGWWKDSSPDDKEADTKYEVPENMKSHDSPNQKYNPGLISNEEADDMGSNSTPDGVLPKYQEMMKEVLKRAKSLAEKTKVKAGSELLMDPPEHDPDTKSKNQSAEIKQLNQAIKKLSR